MPKNITVGLNVGVISVAGLSATGRVKRNLSFAHMKNAVKRCKALIDLEQDSSQQSFGDNFEDYRAEWLSALMSGAASGEAYVNELIDRMGCNPDDVRWKMKALREKTKIFLKVERDLAFNLGRAESKKMQMVLNVRHAIMHFKPFFDDQNQISKELENELPILASCKLVDDGAPFFPMRCISSAYAIWATQCVLGFIHIVDEAVSEERYSKHFGVLEAELSAIQNYLPVGWAFSPHI